MLNLKLNKFKINCYKDKVDYYDNSNRVFYLYNLGRYHNKYLYHYGTTNDIDLVEYNLRKNIPFYERIIYTPIEDYTYGPKLFDDFIENENLKSTLPIDGLKYLDIICSKNENVDLILDKINEIFKLNQEIES